MIPTFVWIRAKGDGWVCETFTGTTRAIAAQKLSARVIEMDMKGEGLVIEPALVLASKEASK